MNTLAAQAAVFTDESVECMGPVVKGSSLHEWATARGVALDPWSHPSRALPGSYYAWAFWESVFDTSAARSMPASGTARRSTRRCWVSCPPVRVR
jgi:FAD-NAD(P)-binding